MAKPKCKNCQCWHEVPAEQLVDASVSVGECQRYPRVWADGRWQYPLHAFDDRCFEFYAKEKPDKAQDAMNNVLAAPELELRAPEVGL